MPLLLDQHRPSKPGPDDTAVVSKAFVEVQLKLHSRPTVKLRLAALRMLFDWMVVGQILPVNPAHAVRGPKHTQKKGKKPVLNVDEARTLIDAIDVTSVPGLRDRALIGLMGLHLRPGGGGGLDEGRGLFCAGAAGLGAAPREGRQRARDAHAPQSRPLSGGVHRRGRHHPGSERAAVSHDARAIRRVDRQFPAPVRCMEDDSPGALAAGIKTEIRLSHLSCHWHHGLSEERRQAGNRPADGCP